MRLTKAIVIGGTGLLAGYLLLVRPRLKGTPVADREVLDGYMELPLKAHSFLRGVPIHSLDHAELRGGRPDMNVVEVYRATGLEDLGEVQLGPATKILFSLRSAIGRAMGWDEVPELVSSISYLSRLTPEEKSRSLVPPGEVRGISRVLYCFKQEMLLEIINKTVHCFWCIAVENRPSGYLLYNAVYVKNLNWRTPIYMTLVSPVLKWVIYPAIGRSIKKNWETTFPQRDALPPLKGI